MPKTPIITLTLLSNSTFPGFVSLSRMFKSWSSWRRFMNSTQIDKDQFPTLLIFHLAVFLSSMNISRLRSHNCYKIHEIHILYIQNMFKFLVLQFFHASMLTISELILLTATVRHHQASYVYKGSIAAFSNVNRFAEVNTSSFCILSSSNNLCHCHCTYPDSRNT